MSDAEESDWNEELEDEVSVSEARSLVVFSRDWTVETIVRQIERGNIDLNPKFQRRNAWTDEKRSKLIESLLIGVPVPEIVLAEDQSRKGAFLVIDGKQRLLAVAGFLESKFEFWKVPKLRGLKTRGELNGKSFAEFAGPQSNSGEVAESEDQRGLRNADIRCTIISNYSDVGVLYDIFYRLNAGSVPLSSQELRQVLNRGMFADFIIGATNQVLPLHDVMRLSEPDARLRDAEILLRYIAFSKYGELYDGNLTPFLDATMARVNKGWDSGLKSEAEELFIQFNKGTARLLELFPPNKVGRKFVKDWETRFNRALFEVQVYYFARITDRKFNAHKEKFVSAFQSFCSTDRAFQDSIETTTKTKERYFTRFDLFRQLINATFKTAINDVPVPKPE
ncbi:DUF262 domain-containing protein [Bradyrhizobium sp. HKCCYLS1011]|uniref:DUF262 domain-containing protein n=1 Tax=Bradyrhizobium sp. HKCCYLS1011 TaxID=3420733 RepID=UPI003EB97B61